MSNPLQQQSGEPGEGSAPAPPGTRAWIPKGGRVRHVLLLADGEKARVTESLGAVVEFLSLHCESVEVRSNVRDTKFDGSFRVDPQPDLVVVLGGDGSVLTACRLFQNDPVPTIGINYGRVGFLASLESSA